MSTQPTGPVRRLTGFDVDEFATSYWGRRPLLRRASERGGDCFTDLLDLDAVDELVSRRGLRTPFLRMAKNGDVLSTGRYTRGGGAGAEIVDQVADDKLLAELAAGSTLVLQGLHRTWPPVVALASDLAADLGHPVQVNAYLTPAQSTGFSPHYDVHDVFVLQLSGRKQWRIHEPVLSAPLRDQPWDGRRDEVAARAAEEPLLEVTLEPGDVLYLPRGYLHAATALGEISGHLTIGVQPVTRAFLAEQVLGLLGHDPELRSSLPAGVDLAEPDEIAADLKATRAALHAAIDRLDDEDVARAVGRHLERRTRPAPLAPFAQLAAAEGLSADSVVRRREGLRCAPRVQGHPQTVGVRVIDRTVSFPLGLEPALRRVTSGGAVRVGDLPEISEQDALLMVRRLLREGVVVPVS